MLDTYGIYRKYPTQIFFDRTHVFSLLYLLRRVELMIFGILCLIDKHGWNRFSKVDLGVVGQTQNTCVFNIFICEKVLVGLYIQRKRE